MTMFSKFIHRVIHRSCGLLLLPVIIITGCAVNSTNSGLYLSKNIDDSSKVELIEKISSDATEFLSWKYAPAKTQFDFEAHTNDEFGNSLKAKLRKKGFSISEKLSGGKILTYILDDNNTIVRLILSVDTTTYGKVYDMNGKNDYKWSVMRKGE